MIKDIYLKKKLTSNWFKLLQQNVCYEFEKIEYNLGKKTGQKQKYLFKKKIIKWLVLSASANNLP